MPKSIVALVTAAAALASAAAALAAEFGVQVGSDFTAGLATSPIATPPPPITTAPASAQAAAPAQEQPSEESGGIRRTKAEREAGLTIEEAKEARAAGMSVEEAVALKESRKAPAVQAPAPTQPVAAPTPAPALAATPAPAPAKVPVAAPAPSVGRQLSKDELRAYINPLIVGKRGAETKALISECGAAEPDPANRYDNLTELAPLSPVVQARFLAVIDAKIAEYGLQKKEEY